MKLKGHTENLAQQARKRVTVLTSPAPQATGLAVGSAHWEPAGQIVQVVLPVPDA